MTFKQAKEINSLRDSIDGLYNSMKIPSGLFGKPKGVEYSTRELERFSKFTKDLRTELKKQF